MLLLAAGLSTACTQLLYTSYAPMGAQMERVTRGLTPTEDPATGLYGYLSDIGLWALAPQYLSAQKFHNGMARVEVRSGYGAINPLGQWVIQPVFRWGSDCDNAMRSIIKGRMAGIELWYAEDPQTELYGFLNHFGAWHIEPQYEDVSSFDSDGFAAAKPVGGRWGIINRQNQWVIQPNFSSRYDAESALRRLTR